jgi:hypothetical protein
VTKARTALALILLLLAACSSPSGVPVESAPRIHNDLTGMACASPSLCFAVGSTFMNGKDGYSDYRTLIERWNGSSWSIVDSPNSASGESHLSKVSCTSLSLCFAVGYDGPYVPRGRPLIVKWNGFSWSEVPTPNVSGLLRDLQCPSSSLCFAVGQYAPSEGNGNGLIERWDGTSWTVMPDLHEGLLFAVGCATPSFCFATGIDYTFQGGHTVALHLTELWDGSSWRVVPSGTQQGEYEVDSISCSSRTQCAGSGSYNNQFPSLSMMEAWDGTSWRAVETPHPAVQANEANVFDSLVSVSCVDASFCMAAGRHFSQIPHSQRSETLVERWGGSTWTIVRSPNGSPSPGFNDALQAVACVSESRCLAIGVFDALDGYLQVLAELWNGTSWSVVPSSNRTG